jgi:hypothetical protein
MQGIPAGIQITKVYEFLFIILQIQQQRGSDCRMKKNKYTFLINIWLDVIRSQVAYK